MTPLASEDWIYYGSMAPIGACSLVGIAYALERFWALRPGRVLPGRFLIEFDDLLARGAFEEAATLCRKSDTPFTRVLLVLASHPRLARAELKERIEEVGRRESLLLEKGIGVLAAVATVGPLLGLLGTVVGMVMIFGKATAGAGLATPQQIAVGISTALHTTVAGLVVAIPAVLTSRYFQSKSDALGIEMEEEAFRVLDLLSGGRGQ